jgi:hypothetical protein
LKIIQSKSNQIEILNHNETNLISNLNEFDGKPEKTEQKSKGIKYLKTKLSELSHYQMKLLSSLME